MAEGYLHGIEIIEVADGVRPIQTVRSSVIGVIGTAPNADQDEFPLNTPILLHSNPTKAALLGAGGTLRDAIDDIYDQVGAVVVVVRVAAGTTDAEAWSNMIGDVTTKTGVYAFLKANAELGVTPKLLIAPGFTSGRPNNGVASVAMTADGAGYDDENPPAVTFAAPPASGIRAEGVAVVVGGSVDAIVVTKPGSGYSAAPAVTIAAPGGTGTQATATATLGLSKNPVAAELEVIAARLRAMVIVDGSGTTDAAAIAYRADFGSDRVMIVEPKIKAWDRRISAYVDRPASARAAGLQAKMDNEQGFWWTFSNQEIAGVGGVSRAIDWNVQDANSQANLLNASQITTVVRYQGFRFWGVRTTSDDPLWAFWNVRRVADMVYESVAQALVWAIDRPFSKQLIVDIVEAVNDYLAHLLASGAILGGRAWIDPTLNSKSQLAQGILRVEFDFEPPAPLEHLKFGARRNTVYYDVLIQDVLREIGSVPQAV
jgi:phage tail sheath protein FI